MNIIALIGFMGTGKTAIGKDLAKTLKRPFIDTDEQVVKVTGMTIPQIFFEKGERRFRKIESRVLSCTLRSSRIVVATGGGIVLDQRNRSLLRKKTIRIWLRASLQEIIKRVKKNKAERPLFFQKSRDQVSALLKKRERYYRESDILVETTGKTKARVVREIIHKLAILGNR